MRVREVVVAFEQCQPEGATEAGYLTVRRSGAVQFSPVPQAQDQLDGLWSAFRQRHPRYRQRFARRDAWIKSLGGRLVSDSAPVPIPHEPASVATIHALRIRQEVQEVLCRDAELSRCSLDGKLRVAHGRKWVGRSRRAS